MEILAFCRAASIVTFCPQAMSSPCHLMQQKGNNQDNTPCNTPGEKPDDIPSYIPG